LIGAKNLGGSGTTVEFRELRRGDIPSFVRVILQGMGPLEAATGFDVTATEGIGKLRRPGMMGLIRLLQTLRIAQIRLFVASDGGQVLGTTTVSFLPNTGYIAGVATDAAARGHGIATRLMELALGATQAKQKPWLSLDVESDNETAIRLYRRLGYTEVSRHVWFVGPMPQVFSPGGTPPVEIRNADRGALEWVSQKLPAAERAPLPPTSRRLTHLEIFSRPPQSSKKTWRLGAGTSTQGIVRGYFGPKTHTGFVFPVGPDPSISEGTCAALVGPAVNWLRSLGATRLVLPVPEPTGAWSTIASSLGLQHPVSTTLMIRATPS
jgi:GNAT superfamily N-acetyltransferase